MTDSFLPSLLPAPLPAEPVAPPPLPRQLPLVPERSEFLEGEEPVATKVEAFLAQAMAASADRDSAAHALVPWMCDVLQVTADHVKLYKRALLEAGLSRATLARRPSVLRGTYKQLAAKGLVAWEMVQGIAAIKAPQVQKNSTASLTQKQAIALLEAIPTDTRPVGAMRPAELPLRNECIAWTLPLQVLAGKR